MPCFPRAYSSSVVFFSSRFLAGIFGLRQRQFSQELFAVIALFDFGAGGVAQLLTDKQTAGVKTNLLRIHEQKK